MEISHLAIWACDIELLRSFYVKYFGMVCGSKYVNTQKSFTSYFLSFADYFFDGFVVDWVVQDRINYSVCKVKGNGSEMVHCLSSRNGLF